MLANTSLALSLGFFSLTLAATPSSFQIQQNADIIPSTNTVLKLKTVPNFEALAQGFGLSGAIAAYTLLKGHGIFAFGNRSMAGDALDANVSFKSNLYPPKRG